MKEVFNGIVQKKLLNPGSRSEQASVVLHTNDGKDLSIRINGHNPFSDPELDNLVGQRVSIQGTLYNNAVFAEKMEDISIEPYCKMPPPPPGFKP